MTEAASLPEPTETKPVKPVQADLLAGFLVFLIALPLCLAIASASKFPPIAGIWTAVVGGVVCYFLSPSQLTIKGPAAGLIVIVSGAVFALGEEFAPGQPLAEQLYVGYRLALGVGVAAGVIQILFGVFRVGRLGEAFPLSAVHGMLAAIGVIIISKQVYALFGIDVPLDEATGKPVGEPLALLYLLPGRLLSANPEIFCIGALSLLILFVLPLFKNAGVKRIPAPMVVLLVAVPLGLYFGLDHRHTYLFPDHFFDTAHWKEYEVGPRFLIDMPDVLQNPAAAFAFPDFRGLATATGWKWVILFAVIGSLESLLSAKAIDLLDPKRRKTDLDRDTLAVGVANTLTSLIGALPMISEIVRSKANIDNGAQTKRANLFHGLFLLGFTVLFANLIHYIPLAALAGMLVYTGFRLASPKEFLTTYKIGVEQLLIFVGTLVGVLATDLLIGIGIGILIKVVLHLLHGVGPVNLFVPDATVGKNEEGKVVVTVRKAAVFGNWLQLRAYILQAGLDAEVTVDLSGTHFVDHTVMEKLHELQHDFEHRGGKLTIMGLDGHKKLSPHPAAARRRRGQHNDRPTPAGR